MCLHGTGFFVLAKRLDGDAHKLNAQVGDSHKRECKIGFPIDFAKKTHLDDDSFPIYMRRGPEDGGETFVNKMGLVVDNRWTVTYNRTLLLMWEGHVNVKLVVSVIGVKYVFKYEFKVIAFQCSSQKIFPEFIQILYVDSRGLTGFS